MGSKNALNGFEKEQNVAFMDQGLLARAIAKDLSV